MSGLPQVDVVILTRNGEPLHPAVEDCIRAQSNVDLVLHRIVGASHPGDDSRYETIARARNEGRLNGAAPWLMFLDDDVVLDPNCIAVLLEAMKRRRAFGALAADYLGEHCPGRISPHVSMGATLFRREALRHVSFRWEEDRCECQCCCDDLRRRRWGIDYCPAARARHLPKSDGDGDVPARHAPTAACCGGRCGRQLAAPSVCLVVCFLGPLPGWIHYYLQSCAFNPTIDFLILTDQANFPAASPNVRVERISAEHFESLATSTLGFPIRLSHARKLCDFKPAFGHLFEELLSPYAYWGYTDLDVIYGDLRRYLNEARLQEFDVFTARSEFLVGHFTLLRNVPEMRMLYRQSRDLRQTLQATSVLSFDECGQQWWQRMEGKPLTDDASCDSMTHIVHRLAACGSLSARFSPAVLEWPELPEKGWRLRWQSGRLSLVGQNREAMYAHFHGFKDNPRFRDPPAYRHEAAFEITPDGIEPPAEYSASTHFAVPSASKATFSERSGRIPTESISAFRQWRRGGSRPYILTTFDRRHFKLFSLRFLPSLRVSENYGTVIPVAVGLSPSQRDRLRRASGVEPVYRNDIGVHVARRRLREFADIIRELAPDTPVAYWDCGDVIFQANLQPLWDLASQFPDKLLVVREPCGYPDNPVIEQWTESIANESARRDAQEIVFHRPFLNSGFLAGTASALTAYFDAVSHWYDTLKLGGSTDPGDQLALNVYCHSASHAWQEVSDTWNYCLWGREGDAWYQRKDGRYLDARGIPIAVVHGNAGTLQPAPNRRARSRA